MRSLALALCVVLVLGGCTETTPSAPSPASSAAADDQDLRAFLAPAGVAVKEIRDSKLQTLFSEGVRARWLRTDQRAIEAVVFSSPTAAARIAICEERANGRYLYRLSGEAVREGSQTIDAAQPESFLVRDRYLVVVYGDRDFASELRRVLGAITPLCVRATPEGSGSLPTSASVACDETPPAAERPSDASTASFTTLWYASADKRVWAGAALPGWHAPAQKVLWVRPAGTPLSISGRRLDSEGTLTAGIPCCYPGDYQASGLEFSAPGCWEIVGKSGGSELRIVVRVAPAPRRVYVLLRADDRIRGFGTSFAFRGPTHVARLSDDGTRIEMLEETARVGLDVAIDGRLLRLRSDPGGGQSPRKILDLLDPVDLKVTASFALPFPATDVRASTSPQMPGKAFVFDHERIATIDLASGKTSEVIDVAENGSVEGCHVAPSVLPVPERSAAIVANVCRANVGWFIVGLDSSLQTNFRYPAPERTYDMAYALSSETLYAASSYTATLRALQTRTGQEQWRTTLIDGVTPSGAKWLLTETQILQTRDGGTLFVAVGPAPDGTLGIRVVDTRTGTVRATYLARESVTGMAITPDDTHLLITGTEDDGRVLAIELATGRIFTLAAGLGRVVGVVVARR